MSQQFSAYTYPDFIFKPKTFDESQELTDQPRFHTWYKGVLTKSEIYERLLPDGESAALRIDGPSDGAIVLDGKGSLRLLTGVRGPDSGPDSGRLYIHTYGQVAKHEGRTNIEYSSGDDTSEKQALNMIAYGDVVEQTIGGTRYLRAQKIVIEASEELMLVGKTQVTIQAGAAGGGTITMNAGSIEKYTSNDKEIIIGQKMEFGVSEKTTLSFDPRASSNIVSPGHINWSILGDYKQWIGGAEQHIVAGNPINIPLIKDRSSTYTVKTAIGAMTFDAAGLISEKAGGIISQIAGGEIDIKAGGAYNADVAGAYAIKVGGAYSANAGGDASMAAGGTANITSAGVVNVIGVGNVNIKGALILLN
jgi:hypothetical protein